MPASRSADTPTPMPPCTTGSRDLSPSRHGRRPELCERACKAAACAAPLPDASPRSSGNDLSIVFQIRLVGTSFSQGGYRSAHAFSLLCIKDTDFSVFRSRPGTVKAL